MSTTYEAPQTPADLLAGVGQTVAGLEQVLWSARRPQELLAAKQELEVLRSQLASVDAVLIHEIEAGGAHKGEQWGSAADYVTAVCAGRRGSGRRDLRVAAALCTDRVRTRGALASGVISVEQERVIVRVVERLPVRVALRDQAEEELLIAAKTLNASELEAWGARLVELLDPDGSDRRDEAALRKQERSAHLGRFFSVKDDGLGGVRVRGRGTVEDAAVIKAALMALTKPDPATQADGQADPQAGQGEGCAKDGSQVADHSTRMWDALVAVCQRALDAGVLPEQHGMKPRVTVTISETDLRERTGTGVLATGESLSASAVRRLACDSDVLPVVLGSRSEILDVGRVQRLVTPVIWNALVVRDRHCTFPGCRRPPVACDAHHLVHWVHGGVTALSNLALLCRTHHTAVHETGWEIRLNRVDQRPEFRPPVSLDPDQRWVKDRALRPSRGDPPGPDTGQ